MYIHGLWHLYDTRAVINSTCAVFVMYGAPIEKQFKFCQGGIYRHSTAFGILGVNAFQKFSDGVPHRAVFAQIPSGIQLGKFCSVVSEGREGGT